MTEVFKLFGTIAINVDDANRSIDEVESNANNLASKMQRSFKKIGDITVKYSAVVASGLAGASAAMTSLIKNSLNEYAEYEQLVGGIETLFKDSSNKVMQYAEQAYRRQGLSANSYLQQVTRFSATLISDLNGDTAAAAEMADIAISDMMDNVNTFGTDLESVKTAYNGFARGEFTMLDNLSLGYSGNNAEMARLVNDSGVLGAYKVDEETVKDLGFDVIIAAIHKIQEELKITGRTADEAALTIKGSWESLKGAWSNFLVGLANDDADMEELSQNLIETGNTWLTNITDKLPVFKENFIEAFNYIAENGGEILVTLGTALDGLFDIDKTTLLAWETIGGVLAVAAGHPVVGIGLLTHASSYAQEAGKEYGEKAWENYQFADALINGDPEAVEKYNSLSPDEQKGYVTKDEWEAEIKQRYIDAGRSVPGAEDTQYTWSTEGFKEIENIFGSPSSNNVLNELQSLVAELKVALDPATLKEAIIAATKEGSKEGSAEGISSATITTGNVTLNDGALVGRILPKIDLGLGQMTLRNMRG